MRFMRFEQDGRIGLAANHGDGWRARFVDEAGMPADVSAIAASTADARSAYTQHLLGGFALDADAVTRLPPSAHPGKIICLGLNYRDHAREFDSPPPSYPTLFARFASSLIGDGQPLMRPRVSTQFDYEGELVVILGRGGRHIAQEQALDHVFGYSVFNDGSLRDFQLRTPQWTVGKNFDGTGAFGPWVVTADELPPGAGGLMLETRLNGQVMQQASTTDMIFGVAQTISIISIAMTLDAGDVIVMGTPSGVGYGRKPPVYMKAGDVCEVSIERIGTLRNVVADEA
ncbi:fumarylacetoacetate hydrolase family protein [Dyella japonica]|uniref:Fumarylacetoacetate hydrolase n=1 Tax=Dyella japonica DSM 16301 TaxID=1440762 RepID=A0A0G9H480_9GAMM|nr:fumarylacetoacetate hydrolase family protein [Dyella japonica]KLD64039.1 fumarylacetoacetate hydrolase [Dyella japonica DSM 16301]